MKPTISADQFWSDLCTLIESDGVTIVQASTDDSAIVAWMPGSSLLRLFTWTDKGLEEVNVRTLCEAPKSVERARQLASIWFHDLAQEEGELSCLGSRKRVIELNSPTPKVVLCVAKIEPSLVSRCSQIVASGTRSKNWKHHTYAQQTTNQATKGIEIMRTIEVIETTKSVRREGEYPCSPEGHMHALWLDHVRLNHRLNPSPCSGQPGERCSGKL